MSRDAFPRLEREYNEREERLADIRERIKPPLKTCPNCQFKHRATVCTICKKPA